MAQDGCCWWCVRLCVGHSQLLVFVAEHSTHMRSPCCVTRQHAMLFVGCSLSFRGGVPVVRITWLDMPPICSLSHTHCNQQPSQPACPHMHFARSLLTHEAHTFRPSLTAQASCSSSPLSFMANPLLLLPSPCRSCGSWPRSCCCCCQCMWPGDGCSSCAERGLEVSVLVACLLPVVVVCPFVLFVGL